MPQGERAEEPQDTDSETASRRRGRYPKGILRRQQILDRTIEVFAEFGFEGTSLRAIGEAIGVSHAALRRYFDTREELFIEVLHEKDRQALANARPDVVETIDFAAHLDDYVARAPGLVALRHSMVARALEPGNEHSHTFFVERYESIRREALLILRLARAAGTVRDDISPEVAASLVIAAMDGLSTQWLLDPRVDMHEGMALLDHLLRPVKD
ncbi:TetR/AcrR family transcriptional regulator [Amycolatopsis sp. GM8]|uniref:TetR/AcrR family transcriptional regulator n=1 Tax=Amycolatopsis sp. GM8 TaxID=2896530 RepID=UPI001F40799F|nr:TetR/AcrR family transcriptional regulator [Amycolatopsis sp. GM8]